MHGCLFCWALVGGHCTRHAAINIPYNVTVARATCRTHHDSVTGGGGAAAAGVAAAARDYTVKAYLLLLEALRDKADTLAQQDPGGQGLDTAVDL
jgi:hypothetical protein